VTGPATDPLLRLDRATRRFGGLIAVSEVSFEVLPGEVKGLIGPNGAGKSTIFDLVTGVRAPSSGDVWFRGKRVTGQPAHTRSPMGMARTFQIVRLFRGLSVLENVQLGMHPKFPDGLRRTLAHAGSLRIQERKSRERAMELLAYVGLADRAGRSIEELTLGQLRLVDIARALAADPVLLMLDEPAAGLNDAETLNLGDMLELLRERGLSMLLVEHDIDFIMKACDSIVVLDRGMKIAEGKPAEVSRNPEVIAAYFGRRAAHAAA
jgi:branched-chain amino acid transport system ATP-binding protein